MVRMKHPTNDPGRLILLQKAAAAGALDAEDSIVYLPPERIDQCNAEAQRFRTALAARKQALSTRQQAAQAVDTALASLQRTVRRIWRQAQENVKEEGHSSALYAYYNLSARGHRPQPQARETWLLQARQVQAGDDAAQAAGFPSVRSRAQLDADLAATEGALTGLAQAEQMFLIRVAEVKDARQAVIALGKQLTRELRLALWNEPEAQRRQMMRRYGVTFTPAPEDGAADALPAPEEATTDRGLASRAGAPAEPVMEAAPSALAFAPLPEAVAEGANGYNGYRNGA